MFKAIEKIADQRPLEALMLSGILLLGAMFAWKFTLDKYTSDQQSQAEIACNQAFHGSHAGDVGVTKKFDCYKDVEGAKLIVGQMTL